MIHEIIMKIFKFLFNLFKYFEYSHLLNTSALSTPIAALTNYSPYPVTPDDLIIYLHLIIYFLLLVLLSEFPTSSIS